MRAYIVLFVLAFVAIAQAYPSNVVPVNNEEDIEVIAIEQPSDLEELVRDKRHHGGYGGYGGYGGGYGGYGGGYGGYGGGFGGGYGGYGGGYGGYGGYGGGHHHGHHHWG